MSRHNVVLAYFQACRRLASLQDSPDGPAKRRAFHRFLKAEKALHGAIRAFAPPPDWQPAQGEEAPFVGWLERLQRAANTVATMEAMLALGQ